MLQEVVLDHTRFVPGRKESHHNMSTTVVPADPEQVLRSKGLNMLSTVVFDYADEIKELVKQLGRFRNSYLLLGEFQMYERKGRRRGSILLYFICTSSTIYHRFLMFLACLRYLANAERKYSVPIVVLNSMSGCMPKIAMY